MTASSDNADGGMKTKGFKGMIGSPESEKVGREIIGGEYITEVGAMTASSCKGISGDSQNFTSAVANRERIRP